LHLSAATAFHAVGTLTFFPICQIGNGGLYIPPDNFRLACDQVVGPLLSAGLFASAAVTWLALLGGRALTARWRA
jgi:hypothetical protein